MDIENHRFGRPGSLESPLCLDNGGEPSKRIVSKKLDDFRETQDTIGRAKNLGHDPRDHLGKVWIMITVLNLCLIHRCCSFMRWE